MRTVAAATKTETEGPEAHNRLHALAAQPLDCTIQKNICIIMNLTKDFSGTAPTRDWRLH